MAVGGQTTSFSYDAAGNLTEQRDAQLQRLCFTYDTLGRLTTHTRLVDNRSYTLSYSGFDPFHRPTTITYPNGQTAVTGFDHEGANSLSNSGTSLISDIQYNARGQMTLLDRTSGGIDTTYLYHPQNDVSGGGLGDSNYRLKTIQHGAAGTGNAWPDFTYEYDKVGNITKMITVSSDGTDTQTFTYDDWNRLISASAAGVSPTYSDSYTYNEIGNIDSYDGLTYSYSSSHKHAVASANGVTYSYDANGNMTLRNASGTVNDYSQNFNVENELSSVVNNGSTTSFAYDASGIRTKTVAANGTVTDFPFPGYEVENATGTQTVRLTFSIAGQAVALKVMAGTNPTYYLYNDHLGSTAKMSTTAGGTVNNSTARFYPFGGWRTEPTAGLTDMGYTDHRHNNLGSAPDDIGLIYMNARWYLPGLGRFISADTIVPDPTNPQSFNRYSYTFNNPLNFTDPSGHDPGALCDYDPKCAASMVDPLAKLKSEYVEGADIVFGPPGSPGVNRYVELSFPFFLVASVVFPFEIYSDGSTELDANGITAEASIGGYFGLGGNITGQLDGDSFTSSHIVPKYEAEIGNGFDLELGGFQFGATKNVSWNSDGTQTIEYSGGALLAAGMGGVVFDPNTVIVRPSEKLARDLAVGKDEAWQQLYQFTYGSSSVLPSPDYSYINTVPSGPIFTDYGGFLPVNVVYTGY